MRGLGALAQVAREIREDVKAARDRDPAARGAGTTEIVLTYPGVHALLAHRVCHALHGADVPRRAAGAGQRQPRADRTSRSIRRRASGTSSSSTTAAAW